MTITNGYCTLDDIKHTNRLNFNDSDSVSDDMLEGVIEAVSRKIDDACNRFFYQTTSQSRWYQTNNANYVFVDDISASSDVTVEIDNNDDGTADVTLTSANYILEPYNAELQGIPYQKITIRKSGQYLLPSRMDMAVKVTAIFGWSSVPKPIAQACMLQCERLFKRFSTPLGSESMTALGKMTLSIPSLDPDVEDLISRYKKIVFG